MEAWSNGVYTGPTTDETIQLNSKALGKIEAIEDILYWINEEGDEDDE